MSVEPNRASLPPGPVSVDPGPVSVDAGRAGADLLGSELTAPEARLLAVYEELKALCGEDLPPVAHANVRAALALVHNVVGGLALRYEHLSDLGV